MLPASLSCYRYYYFNPKSSIIGSIKASSLKERRERASLEKDIERGLREKMSFFFLPSTEQRREGGRQWRC